MRQVIISGSSDRLSSSATEYNSIRFHKGPAWKPTESQRQELSSGTFKVISLFVQLTASPGSGNNYQFTVRNNAVDTSAVVTISDSETEGKIEDLSIPIVAEDLLSLKVVPTSTPDTASAKWAVVLETEGDGKVFYISGQDNSLNTALPSELNNLDSGSNWSLPVLNSVNKDQITPLAGTFKDFYVELDGTAGTGSDGWIFKPRKNGVESGMAVYVLGSATTGNDTSNTFSVVAGDTVDLSNAIRGNSANVNNRKVMWGITFECDTEEYPMLAGTSNNLHRTNTEYNYITGTDATWTSTEGSREMLTTFSTLSKLYVKLGKSPGTGTSYKFTIMKNGVATDSEVTIEDGNTTGNDTVNIVECSDFDVLSIRCIPTSGPFGSPVQTNATWSFAIKSIFPFPNSLMLTGNGI